MQSLSVSVCATVCVTACACVQVLGGRQDQGEYLDVPQAYCEIKINKETIQTKIVPRNHKPVWNESNGIPLAPYLPMSSPLWNESNGIPLHLVSPCPHHRRRPLSPNRDHNQSNGIPLRRLTPYPAQ